MLRQEDQESRVAYDIQGNLSQNVYIIFTGGRDQIITLSKVVVIIGLGNKNTL